MRRTERHAAVVTFIGVEAGDGQMHSTVELEFLLDDPKRSLRAFTVDRPVEDVVGDRIYSIGKG